MNKEASPMGSLRTNRVRIFCIIAAVALFSVLSENEAILASFPDPPGGPVYKSVEVSGGGTNIDLSQKDDERIVWTNSSRSGVYVCVDPKTGPFDAYAWYVPPGGTRKTDKIRDDIKPNPKPLPPLSFDYHPSPRPCAGLRPKSPITTPHIIIHTLE